MGTASVECFELRNKGIREDDSKSEFQWCSQPMELSSFPNGNSKYSLVGIVYLDLFKANYVKKENYIKVLIHSGRKSVGMDYSIQLRLVESNDQDLDINSGIFIGHAKLDEVWDIELTNRGSKVNIGLTCGGAPNPIEPSRLIIGLNKVATDTKGGEGDLTFQLSFTTSGMAQELSDEGIYKKYPGLAHKGWRKVLGGSWTKKVDPRIRATAQDYGGGPTTTNPRLEKDSRPNDPKVDAGRS